jgi:WD40 repeat protein
MSVRAATFAIGSLALAAVLAGCAGRPRMLAEASAPGASEVRWACHDSLLVVALRGWGVSLVDSRSGSEQTAFRLPDIPPHAARGLAVSAAGETLAVAMADSVIVFATRGLKPLFATPGSAATLALSSDGEQLLWSDGTVGRLLEVRTGRVRWQGSLEAEPGALVWAEPLARFLVPRDLRVVSAAEEDWPSFTLDTFEGARPWRLALPSVGATLAVAESTMHVSMWDLPSKHFRRRLVLGGTGRLEHLALSRNAQLLATSLGGRARVLWTRSGRTVADWAPHGGAEVEDMAFASDGLRLATVGANGSVRTWDMPGIPAAPRGHR